MKEQGGISPEERMRMLSRRSFLWAGAATLGAGGLWQSILRSPRRNGMLAPLRSVNELNRDLWEKLFREGSLAPEFDRRLAGARYNSNIGLTTEMDPSMWRLKVEGLETGDRLLTLEDLKRLPRVEQTTEFKCIEGWSQIMTFAGARMLDFAQRYRPKVRSGAVNRESLQVDNVVPYVWMETPDGAYFVGLDTPSALHPQTLLAYEMNGEPLEVKHGAPLRLVIPVKYGIKNIKRIGRIRFTDVQPRDYWYEDGYDWYAGL
ncbi:MAG: molybdopterin-dependent oxidoreductase [Fimbriimonadaceae bacterium]|nr:molybdopterin-dependent oxidoreductase [Fimbriimonadaceae bacterium]